MSLEKIIDKIKRQAAAEATKITAEAKAKLAQIEESRREFLERLEAETKREEAAIETEVKNAIVLPSKLKVRGEKLEAKNKLFDKAFREAMDFSDAEYKKVLIRLFSQIPKKLKGAVISPAEGKEEITKKFVKEENVDVKIGQTLKGVMGGFVMTAGKIEYDCTFDTLLRKLKEKLEPEVAPLFDVD